MEEETVFEVPVYNPALKQANEVYKPSGETLQQPGEQNRTKFSELFIENERLGPLKDLCAAEVARSFGPSSLLPSVAENPLVSQVHYDGLDIDLPLEKCYHITEDRYWKRVVLAKHYDKTLPIKRNVNWKNLGVCLKFVELVEQCPVEYWPEDEIKELAFKIQEFVMELHIKRLQSLRESSFRKYFITDSEESSTEESSYEEGDESEILPIEEENETSQETMNKTESQLRLQAELAQQRAELLKERQELKEAKQKARELKEAKRKKREAKKLAKENPEKKPRKKVPYNMFKIQISDSEDDDEELIVDKRNKSLYLSHIKKYNYPDQDCHHINLNFVQYFTNLETFILEFLGPLQGRYYHKRHHRFSINDIKNLSAGLRHLTQLKIFRLRNSSMDADKLRFLSQGVAALPCLETLDLGYDQLNDDCGPIFEDIFEATKSLQNLELESNFLGEESLNHIGKALKDNEATELLYLGLARNPINDQALHNLATQIMGTKHIKYLNITGVQFLSDHGICCCLSRELLRNHPVLIKLVMCAVPVSQLAADEIIKSLVENNTILEICCTECGLDLETDIDIKVLLERNKYISQHSYLGDPNITDEEIANIESKIRNPILLKVLAEREKHETCLENRPQISKTHLHLQTPTSSRDSLDIRTQLYERHKENTSLNIEKPAVTTSTERFVYPVNDFTKREFLAHIYQPGPEERYSYFKDYKQKYSTKDNIKNISLI